ncbi:MAG: carbohydrate-binding family 9-like protein [Bacteroidota bacterium]
MLKIKIFLGLLFLHVNLFAQKNNNQLPKSYVCYHTTEKLQIDGELQEPNWQNTPWTETFVDIEGDKKPLPLFETKVKMLWDNDYLYIAAFLEEPHLWATYDQRDMVIFHENNFEVFIDPDGDTHQYYEFEINALETFWDLMLMKPYRDGGSAVNSWDIKGLKKAVKLNGTLNDGSDTDTSWVVEMAFPWEVLKECAPKGRKPSSGEYWRVNFSRVKWKTEWKSNKYIKVLNPETGKAFPEFNWVWSPQGVINMQQPETWGYLQFSNKEPSKELKKETFEIPEVEAVKMMLRKLYYLQQEKFHENESYFIKKEDLQKELNHSANYDYTLIGGQTWYRITIVFQGDKWVIREDGKIWNENL